MSRSSRCIGAEQNPLLLSIGLQFLPVMDAALLRVHTEYKILRYHAGYNGEIVKTDLNILIKERRQCKERDSRRHQLAGICVLGKKIIGCNSS